MYHSYPLLTYSNHTNNNRSARISCLLYVVFITYILPFTLYHNPVKSTPLSPILQVRKQKQEKVKSLGQGSQLIKGLSPAQSSRKRCAWRGWGWACISRGCSPVPELRCCEGSAFGPAPRPRGIPVCREGHPHGGWGEVGGRPWGSCFSSTGGADDEGCEVNGRRYRDGETFQPHCRTRCRCEDGGFTCVPLCSEDVRLPSWDCPSPRRIEVPGKCCPEWVCDKAAGLGVRPRPAQGECGAGPGHGAGAGALRGQDPGTRHSKGSWRGQGPRSRRESGGGSHKTSLNSK